MIVQIETNPNFSHYTPRTYIYLWQILSFFHRPTIDQRSQSIVAPIVDLYTAMVSVRPSRVHVHWWSSVGHHRVVVLNLVDINRQFKLKCLLHRMLICYYHWHYMWSASPLDSIYGICFQKRYVCTDNKWIQEKYENLNFPKS